MTSINQQDIWQNSAAVGDGASLKAEIIRLRQALEQYKTLTIERDTLKSELARWKVCANCGEPLTEPGICDKAVSEKEKGLELMHEQTLDRAEAAEAQHDRLEQQARDISVLLSDAGCNAMPIPEGVRWLLGRAEAAESTIAAMTAERNDIQAERAALLRLEAKQDAELTWLREAMKRVLADENVLFAPCIWCGYKGQGYWQEGTHDSACLFHKVGGESARHRALRAALASTAPTT